MDLQLIETNRHFMNIIYLASSLIFQLEMAPIVSGNMWHFIVCYPGVSND